MKIAYLSRGHTIYDRRFLEKMVERGYEPYLISYFSAEVVRVKGVTTLHCDIRSLPFSHLTWLQISCHLRKLLREIQPDVLHSEWITDHGFYGALSGFHPTLSMPKGSDILVQPDESRIAKMIARFTLNRADKITCDCQLVKDKIIKLTGCSPEKIVIFPWGIDLGIFNHSNEPSPIRKRLGWEDNEILIMNRWFYPIYGVEYFIESLPVVVQQRPKARVILIGEGILEDTFKKRISELGLDDYVHFACRVNEAEMAAYLNAADVYVTTSLSDGTSCSMLEAMACGLPVVVSDAPVYYEWVDDGVNGFIIPRKDSFALADRLVELLGNRALRREMGKRNLTVAKERADWEKNFDVLEDIYQKLVCI